MQILYVALNLPGPQLGRLSKRWGSTERSSLSNAVSPSVARTGIIVPGEVLLPYHRDEYVHVLQEDRLLSEWFAEYGD